MDDGIPIMPTLIDDGLVETCVDDPVSLMDLDQFTVIDIDDIDATIEDPGYILDEASNMLNRNEEYTSSYKKRSFTLPVTFFDISRNISLLKKCRPISVKIVDCNIYPWYYKETKHVVRNNYTTPHKDEGLNQKKGNYDNPELISSPSCDSYIEDPVCLSHPISFSNISLSSEQRSVVLKLKEEINKHAYVRNINKNIIDDVNKEKLYLENHDDLLLLNNNTSECNFDKGIESLDLLTYKAIAQTIVRKIDHNGVNSKADNVTEGVQNLIINGTSEKNAAINNKKCERNKKGEKRQDREKISTSPILPCKSQKKSKRKENMLRKSPNAINILEKCSNSNRNCDKFMSSVNQVIPHYHCRVPVPANDGYNFCFMSMVANQMHSQVPISEDPSLHWYQQINKKDIVSGTTNAFLTHDSKERLVTFPNIHSIGEMPYFGFSEKLHNNYLINNSQVTEDQLIENVNTNINTPISDRQFHFPNSLSYQSSTNAVPGSPRQSNIKNRNSLRLVRRVSANQVSKENFRVFPQPPSFSKNIYDNCVSNSMCSLNEYVNYSRTQIPLQKTVNNMTNIIQSNPLLSQLLNCNNVSKHYHSALEHDGLGPKSVGGKIPHPAIGQNFWLPPRQPPPPPSYEYSLSSAQFTQDKNFHYPNTGIHLKSFANSDDTNLLHHETNANLKLSEINSNELPKDCNLKNIPVGATTIMNSMSSKINYMKRNICIHTEKQNINHISTDSTKPTKPNQLISNNINAKINDQNIINFSTEPVETKDVKISNKHNIDNMINVLSNKKYNCLYSEVHKCNNQNDFSLLKKSTFNLNPLMQCATPDSYPSDNSISKVDKASKTDNINLQPPKNVNISTSEQVESNINGYSPPILPIPSFKRSLEMLSELQHSPALNITEKNNLKTETYSTRDTSKQGRIRQEHTNVIRKRKLKDDESMTSKKISLQEYKLRRSENDVLIT